MITNQPEQPRRNLMAFLSLIVGWIHLIFATILAIGLFIYLCVYYNKSDDSEEEISPTGLPSVIFLCVFSVASVVFDILLIRGISQMRVTLISFYVYGNYMALGIFGCLSIICLVRDIKNDVPFGRFMIHRLLHALILVAMMYLVYPVKLLHQQMRNTKEQSEEPERRRLSGSAPIDKPLDTVPNGENVVEP